MPIITRKRLITWLLPVIIIAIGFSVVRYLGSTAQRPTPEVSTGEVRIAGDTATVSVFRVSQNTEIPELVLYGQMAANRQVTMTAPFSALITELPIEAGDQVVAGQVLARLDTRNLEHQLAQQQTRLQDLRARQSLLRAEHEANIEAVSIEEELLSIAEQTVTRTRNLRQRNVASDSDLDAAERAMQQQRMSLNTRQLAVQRYADQQAQLAAQEAEVNIALEQLQDQLDNAEIRAPFTGQIADVNTEVATRVSAQSPLFTLLSQDDVRLNVSVPTTQLTSLRPGMAASTQYDAVNYALTLTGWEPITRGGAVTARFAFDEAPEQSAIDQFFRLQLQLDPLTDVFAVPATLVYENRYVYRVQDERLQRVDVNVVGYQQRGETTWALLRSTALASGDPLLASRLADAATGLAVIVREETN